MRPVKSSLLTKNKQEYNHNQPDYYHSNTYNNHKSYPTVQVPYQQFQQPQNKQQFNNYHNKQTNIQMKTFHHSKSYKQSPVQSSIRNQNTYYSNIPQKHTQYKINQNLQQPTIQNLNQSCVSAISSSNFQANINKKSNLNPQISNLQNYQVQNRIIRQPFIPPIIQTCKNCNVAQHIPGDTHQFYCCSCDEASSAIPKFGLFYCGTCRNKVCYALNISDRAQCIWCYTINKVPIKKANKKNQKYEKSQINDLRSQSDREVVEIIKELQEQKKYYN